MEVEVIHPYEPQQTDELLLKKGDIIKNVAAVEIGWCYGDLRGRQGVFPDNFVKVVGSDNKKSTTDMSPQTLPLAKKRDMEGRRCKVLFSYAPQHEDELPLCEGNVINVIEEVEEGWWKGTLNGKVGMFPSNFVTEVEQEKGNEGGTKPVGNADNKAVNGIGSDDQIRQNAEMNGMFKNNLASSNSAFHPVQFDKNIKDAVVEAPKKPPHSSDANAKINTISKVSKPSAVEKEKEKDRVTINVGDGGTKKIIGQKVLPSSIDLKQANVEPLIPPPQLPPRPVREYARAIFPYTAEHEDELELRENDVIIVLCRELEDKGWWKGELQGKIGVFPDNFVEIVSSEDSQKPPRPEKPVAAPHKPISPPVTPANKASGHPPLLPAKKTAPPPLPTQKKPANASSDVLDKDYKLEEEDPSLSLGRETPLRHIVHNRPKGPANRKPPSQMFLDDCRKSSDMEQVLATLDNETGNDTTDSSTREGPVSTTATTTPLGHDSKSPGAPPPPLKEASGEVAAAAAPWLTELRESQVRKRRHGGLSVGETDSSKVTFPSDLSPTNVSSNQAALPPPPPLSSATSLSPKPLKPTSKEVSSTVPPVKVELSRLSSHSTSSNSSNPRPSSSSNPVSFSSSSKQIQPSIDGSPTSSNSLPRVRSLKHPRVVQNGEAPPDSAPRRKPLQESPSRIPEADSKSVGDSPSRIPEAVSPASLDRIYDELVPKIKQLEERLEEHQQTHTRQLKLLMSELDEERKKRACMQVEIDRLDRLVSVYGYANTNANV